jgi:hypothetical protein
MAYSKTEYKHEKEIQRLNRAHDKAIQENEDALATQQREEEVIDI